MRQIDRRLHVHVLDVDQLRFVTWPDRLLRTRAGGGQNVVLMTGAGSGMRARSTLVLSAIVLSVPSMSW
jgi:hypothetical protein